MKQDLRLRDVLEVLGPLAPHRRHAVLCRFHAARATGQDQETSVLDQLGAAARDSAVPDTTQSTPSTVVHGIEEGRNNGLSQERFPKKVQFCCAGALRDTSGDPSSDQRFRGEDGPSHFFSEAAGLGMWKGTGGYHDLAKKARYGCLLLGL